MYQNRKFHQSAKRRKYLAIFASILLHLAVIMAISDDNATWKQFVPDFILSLVEEPVTEKETVPIP